jgi:hypothetical protein
VIIRRAYSVAQVRAGAKVGIAVSLGNLASRPVHIKRGVWPVDLWTELLYANRHFGKARSQACKFFCANTFSKDLSDLFVRSTSHFLAGDTRLCASYQSLTLYITRVPTCFQSSYRDRNAIGRAPPSGRSNVLR